MPNLNNLLFTSDFDTIKNDGATTATVNIPASAVIAAGATQTYETTVSVGTPSSLLLVLSTNNVDFPDGRYLTLSTTYRSDRTGSAVYSVYVRQAHVGGNNVKLMCQIWNNGASPLTLSATAETWNFIIRTIRVPRFS